ncbi:hypothetical protein SUDANB176_00232 [Streptomyces sp. enrichment culture]|uniref:hypothetical protein n=1 Tax=Streptomyces sp. enrichment culture TaxID=1795815 RepID=UPI003F57C0BB
MRGTGESPPTAPARIVGPDPAVRAAATDNALREVTHQNTVYEATVPVALYAAAGPDHPAVAEDAFGHDADDACVAVGERHFGKGFPDENREMRAFRDLRPAIFSAAHPFPSHDNADVRDAALLAAIGTASWTP